MQRQQWTDGRTKRVDWLLITTHVVSLLPLLVLLGTAWQRQLGPDPIGEATRRAGRYAIAWLLLSLVPTAARVLFGWPALLRVRRVLGLYAFLYATVHLLIYVGIDYAFDLALVLEGVRQSRFILAGAAALLILLILAITSTNGWVRRLGRHWRRLHRLVYLAGGLAVLHYAWNYKELRNAPLVTAAVLVLLLLLRLPLLIRVPDRWRGPRS